MSYTLLARSTTRTTLLFARIVQKFAQNVQKYAQNLIVYPILANKCIFDPPQFFFFFFHQKWIPYEKLDIKHVEVWWWFQSSMYRCKVRTRRPVTADAIPTHSALLNYPSLTHWRKLRVNQPFRQPPRRALHSLEAKAPRLLEKRTKWYFSNSQTFI